MTKDNHHLSQNIRVHTNDAGLTLAADWCFQWAPHPKPSNHSRAMSVNVSNIKVITNY